MQYHSLTRHRDDVSTPQRFARCAAILLASALAASANALPSYEIVPLGFTDAEHTRNDGYQWSEALGWLTESGQILGHSERYNGGDGLPFLGFSGWIYDASDGSTTRLGFFDASHTRSDGQQDTSIDRMTESGYVIGTSDRYLGAASAGTSAWFYDANDGTTTRLGLFDAAHTSIQGEQVSGPELHVTESGYAAGESQRYAGSVEEGHSAWLYHAGDDSVIRVGFFDAAHTRNDGMQNSTLYDLGNSGHVVGSSERFNGGSKSLGFSA